MQPLLYNFGSSEELFDGIVSALNAKRGQHLQRHYPDGETYLRFLDDCTNRHVIIVCSLNGPDAKTLPLLLASDTLRDLGAERVGLIAPYLAYMRQDKRFNSGEGVTAAYYANLLSQYFDWLVTVDPHLHRIHALSEVYTIPTAVVDSAPQLAEWIKNNISMPVLIGPDSESRQWVAKVARKIGTPFLVLNKIRTGDSQVEVSAPQIEGYRDRLPVLIDDIISTGQTLMSTAAHLKSLGMQSPVCAAVHGIFADGAEDKLLEAGFAQIVTCNTIYHKTNAINLAPAIAETTHKLLEEYQTRTQ